MVLAFLGPPRAWRGVALFGVSAALGRQACASPTIARPRGPSTKCWGRACLPKKS